MKIAMGYMAAKFLFAANEIGLFDALASGTANLEELATRIAVPSRTTGIVAATMLSLGLIEQKEGRYRNSAAAAAFFVGKACPICGRCCGTLTHSAIRCGEKREAVRLDSGQGRFAKFDLAQQHTYSAGVEAITAPVAAALSTSYDFGSHRRLLDVQGGTGSLLLAVLRHYSALRGTLFELPQVCTVARQRLAKEPERTRIDIVEGDL